MHLGRLRVFLPLALACCAGNPSPDEIGDASPMGDAIEHREQARPGAGLLEIERCSKNDPRASLPFEFEATELDLFVGDQVMHTAGPCVRFDSSDETVMTVDGAGVVSALAPGQATLTARHGGENTSIPVLVVANSFDVTAWVGTEDSEVIFGAGAEGLELSISMAAPCVSVLQSCVPEEQHITDGFSLTNGVLTQSRAALLRVTHGDAEASVVLATKGRVSRAKHAAISFQNRMVLLGGELRARFQQNSSAVSSDGVNWEPNVNGSSSNNVFRSDASLVEFQDSIWVLGGRSALGGYSNKTYYSGDGQNWAGTGGPDVALIRARAAAVTFDGRMWLIAGEDDDGPRNDVWWSENGYIWELATDSAAFTPRAGARALAFDGRMWLIGGDDLSEVWSSADGETWIDETSSDVFTPRSRFDVTLHEGQMWLAGGVAGGADAGAELQDLWSSADGTTWVEHPGANYGGRHDHSLLSQGGRLWVLGGTRGIAVAPDDVWSSAGTADFERHYGVGEFGDRDGHTLTSFAGKLWVVGGFVDGAMTNDVWSSEDGIVWTRVTADAGFSPRARHSAHAHDGRLWVIGGQDGAGEKNDVWSSADGASWQLKSADADFSPRSFHSSLSFNNSMWVISGRYGTGEREVWSSSDGIDWTLVAEVDAVATFTKSVHVLGDRLWVIDEVSGEVWSSLDGETWLLVGDALPFGGRLGSLRVAAAGRLWVMGSRFPFFGSVDVWSSIDGETWELVADVATITPRSAPLVEHQGAIVLVGDGETTRDAVWSTLDRIEWRQAQRGRVSFEN